VPKYLLLVVIGTLLLRVDKTVIIFQWYVLVPWASKNFGFEMISHIDVYVNIASKKNVYIDLIQSTVNYKLEGLWINLRVPRYLHKGVLAISGIKCLCCNLVTHTCNHSISGCIFKKTSYNKNENMCSFLLYTRNYFLQYTKLTRMEGCHQS
jgi:hypothetical protein